MITLRWMLWLSMFVCTHAVFEELIDSIQLATTKILRLFDIPKTAVSDPLYYKNRPKVTMTVFDFIVVGMGAGGCVVANRLTEDYRNTVLIIESGQEDNVITDVPAANPYTLLTDYSYNFETEPDPRACQGHVNQRCPWASGKGSGGGTILSGLIWTRGNYRDYDNWAKVTPGWSYNDVLPYFLKSENMIIPELRGSPYHGTSGFIPVEYVKYITPLLSAFLNAASFFGYRIVDYNNPRTHVGFSQIQSVVKGGERFTAATAYIKPILHRKNLYISMRSRVIKILINPLTKNAYGVKYVKRGAVMVAYARKEVILAAGAFNSPQILMLSGIGRRDHLHEIGIPVLKDLPVGDGLKEHVGMHGLTFLINQKVNIAPLSIFQGIVINALKYFLTSSGPFKTLGCEGIGYVKTKYSNTSRSQPDIELVFIASAFNTDAGILLRKTFGISDELYDYTYREIDGIDSFSIWPMLMYPKSEGKVRLKDENPFNQVRIWHNFYKEDIDVAMMVEGIKKAILLTEAPSFRKYGSVLHRTPFPQCRTLRFGSDGYWACALRTMTTTWHHQCCTNRMGRVVDNNLKVLGISRLRVVDASVFPDLPGAHTQAPTYMLAEKASDIIKADWGMYTIKIH
ncbi:hypothetical protein GE061_006940 [Apolygus lucorum]|uniref:Glucose-methanol-choline oxidoreductase N-terminal domain-containing protein n=1 Tax=Apolygus lucorum TaxID=248454 RepID=A0A8S9WQI8_APOLU|nr:hypothetical protein GE061_006940 [Apolygus lucorum]